MQFLVSLEFRQLHSTNIDSIIYQSHSSEQIHANTDNFITFAVRQFVAYRWSCMLLLIAHPRGSFMHVHHSSYRTSRCYRTPSRTREHEISIAARRRIDCSMNYETTDSSEDALTHAHKCTRRPKRIPHTHTVLSKFSALGRRGTNQIANCSNLIAHANSLVDRNTEHAEANTKQQIEIANWTAFFLAWPTFSERVLVCGISLPPAVRNIGLNVAPGGCFVRPAESSGPKRSARQTITNSPNEMRELTFSKNESQMQADKLLKHTDDINWSHFRIIIRAWDGFHVLVNNIFTTFV